MMRTDFNNNPTAMTSDVAKQGGLELNVDYTIGTPFPAPSTLTTANLLGDPIALSIRVIDKIGYKTHAGTARWNYINMPKFIWDVLTRDQKRDVIGFHYQYEGGTAMRDLFPNYGKA